MTHPAYRHAELVATRTEASAILGVCVTRVDQLKLPRLRQGRRTLYRVADLMAHLEKRGRPLTELQASIKAAVVG